MRKVMTGLASLAAAWLASGVAGHSQTQPGTAAPEMVLVNGAVLTVDARDSVAEAVA